MRFLLEIGKLILIQLLGGDIDGQVLESMHDWMLGEFWNVFQSIGCYLGSASGDKVYQTAINFIFKVN